MDERRTDVARLCVLIADDNADTREMYALYLNMSGYRVGPARFSLDHETTLITGPAAP